MTTVYIENPRNFQDISNYVVTDTERICKEIIQAQKCFFYDTCSFRTHANLLENEKIIQYIKWKGGLVVITRCVLMELASLSGDLQEIYKRYFEKMYQNGLLILILNEEDTFKILEKCYSLTADINTFLGRAIKTVKQKTGSVESTLKENVNLRNKLLDDKKCIDKTLFSDFFQAVRNNKEAGDNLGEELIAICLHLLANLPEAEEYKYQVLSDDKGAAALIGKVKKNCLEYLGVRTMSLISTAKLVQLMHQEGVINTEAQIEALLSTNGNNDNIKIMASETFDLETVEKKMSKNELAEKIVLNIIHINY
jgi:hypothetical protein